MTGCPVEIKRSSLEGSKFGPVSRQIPCSHHQPRKVEPISFPSSDVLWDGDRLSEFLGFSNHQDGREFSLYSQKFSFLSIFSSQDLVKPVRPYGFFRGSNSERALHINNLKLLAIFKDLGQLESLLIGKAVAIMSDNSTALSYIKKRGGPDQSLCSSL